MSPTKLCVLNFVLYKCMSTHIHVLVWQRTVISVAQSNNGDQITIYIIRTLYYSYVHFKEFHVILSKSQNLMLFCFQVKGV